MKDWGREFSSELLRKVYMKEVLSKTPISSLLVYKKVRGMLKQNLDDKQYINLATTTQHTISDFVSR